MTIADQLFEINRSCTVSQLELSTRNRGAFDLANIRYHVQGIARSDLNGKAKLAVSVSGRERGLLWFADFELAGGRLATEGRVHTELPTVLPHPGGMQASGNLLAVACEGGLFARIEVYDLLDLDKPPDSLVLNNSLKEGVSQLTGSAAGWLTFAEQAPGEYLLFVGGRSFAQREGWFYRYRPGAASRWEFLGNFAGDPRRDPNADDANTWGPQSGAAMVREDAAAPWAVVTFGGKGPKKQNAYKPRIRCFDLDSTALPYTLVHKSPTLSFPGSGLSSNLLNRFDPNVRWGSTAFVGKSGELLTYFTARNPRPAFPDHTHVLRINEVRAR